MDASNFVALVEQILDRQLGSLERFVLQQSWLNRTYAQMAQMSSYGNEYVKHVGFNLWSELSNVLDQTVSKKKLHLVFSDERFQQLLPSQPTATTSALDQSATEPSSPHILEADSCLEVPVSEETVTGEDKPRSPDLLSGTQLPDKKPDFPSGPVSLDSPLYIKRAFQEETAMNELVQPGCLLRVKAPCKMGKSSLLNRLLIYGESKGYRTVRLNLKEADKTTFANLDCFLKWFCANLSLQLNLPSQVSNRWDEEIGSKVNCKLYMRQYILSEISEAIILGIDELNQVFEYPLIAQDFLPMLRVWYEQARDDEVWRRLRMVLVHATDFYVPLKLNQSPFNVGLSVKLPPFSFDQFQELARRYGLSDLMSGKGAWQLKSLYRLIKGHPYLSSLAFYTLRYQQISLSEVLERAAQPNGIYRHHLQRCLTLLKSEPALAEMYLRVVKAEEGLLLDALSAYKLESLGLIIFKEGLARASCGLYRKYFSQQLGEPLG